MVKDRMVVEYESFNIEVGIEKLEANIIRGVNDSNQDYVMVKITGRSKPDFHIWKGGPLGMIHRFELEKRKYRSKLGARVIVAG